MKIKYKIISCLAFLLTIWLCWPMDNTLRDKPTSFVLFDANNQLMGARIASDGQWRFPMMDSVPYKFKQAILSFEDKDFYGHLGVDFTSLGRACIQNYKQKRVVSGASTITMQLMRLNYPNAPRKVLQKIKEIILSFKVELHRSKENILLEYCTHAPFGGNVVGMETASWRYFKKSPENLSWSEASLLAVLPNAPSLIHPGKNRNLLKKKRDFLLKKLYERNLIDSIEWQLSLLEPIVPSPQNLQNEAPHFLEKIKKENSELSRVYSTLNKELQNDVQQIIQNHNAINSQKGIYNAGVIIVKNDDKKILSYIGNTKGRDNQNYNDMVMAPRSSGSILKPLLYGLAIEDGLISPYELAADIPLSYNGFSPKNYNRKYHGAIAMDAVIAKSLNVPSVALLQKYNLTRFLGDLKQLGFRTFDKDGDYYGLPLILGGGDVCLWDLANVYSELAQTLNTFNSKDAKYLKNSSNKLVWNQKYNPELPVYGFESNKMSAGSIWSMLQAMKKIERPNDDGQWEKFSSSKDIHWKTGTSYGYKDAWSVGISKEYTVAVWVGNSSGEPRPDIIGVSAAGSVLFDVFNALSVKESFDQPFDDLVQKEFCVSSGHMAGEHCHDKVDRYLPLSALTSKSCPYHKLIYVNKENGQRVFKDCLADSEIVDTSWFNLPPEMAYFYKSFNPSYASMPTLDASCQSFSENASSLAFIYPKENIEVVLPKNLKSERENCVLKASHKDANSKVFWHVNNSYFGKTEDFHEIELNLEAGEYVVSIHDEYGNSKQKKIKVLTTD